jgi:hypothetical protein
MEDRVTTGVYLELTSFEPDAYRQRAGELLRLRGTDRVSWWANCRPGRHDFPRRVPEGTLLGLAEVDDDFVAPDPPEGCTARLFRRHPRPAQGILTGRPTTGLLLVWIAAKAPELEQALRDWADFVHIRHIAAAGIPGFAQITPYDHVGEGDPRYMHLYEFDDGGPGGDPEDTFQQMLDFVAPRLGGADSDEFRRWADLRAAGGYMVYVNTFRFLDAREAAD